MSMPSPLSSKYDPRWVRANSLGENALHLAEGLSSVMHLKPGMRVLDLGCGRAITSIFLAKEFGVTVWAIDDAIPASENIKRIEDAGCEGKIFAIEASVADLTPSTKPFDVIVAIQSYMYYGATGGYLPYILKFLKPSGHIGIVDACFTREVFPSEAATELAHPKHPKIWSKMHSLDWWKDLWQMSGLVELETAEYLPQANFILDEYVQDHISDSQEHVIVEALLNDSERLFSLFRMVARKS